MFLRLRAISVNNEWCRWTDAKKSRCWSFRRHSNASDASGTPCISEPALIVADQTCRIASFISNDERIKGLVDWWVDIAIFPTARVSFLQSGYGRSLGAMVAGFRKTKICFALVCIWKVEIASRNTSLFCVISFIKILREEIKIKSSHSVLKNELI